MLSIQEKQVSTSPFPIDNIPPPSTNAEEAMDNYAELLRAKILHALKIYPALSPTMIHVALGTSTSAVVWKAVLEELIAEGLVVRREITATSPHDRVQNYTVIHLAETEYTVQV